MLRLLSGREHRVITGVALLEIQSCSSQVWATTTRVLFRCLSSDEIEWYVATGEPMDKAGAYGIQERAASFVTRIDGCHANVVGLPLGELMRRLMSFPTQADV